MPRIHQHAVLLALLCAAFARGAASASAWEVRWLAQASTHRALTCHAGFLKEVQDTLRASDGDGWVLVAGTAKGRVELVHAGTRAPEPSTPVVLASAMKWITAAVVLSVLTKGVAWSCRMRRSAGWATAGGLGRETYGTT